ncbi:MAG TPA: hypothetical protein PLJ74_06140 [Myxococcota bacterium]|nr:hypothetical protein [Myxococcota bacterium]
MLSSFKLSDNLYLNSVTVLPTRQQEIIQTSSVHRIIVTDVSGSMSGDLPQLRRHLIEWLPKNLNQDDALSIVWFSGRGQCGMLMENQNVSTLADLENVKLLINRWLVPVGMTGFVDPLKEVKRLCDEYKDYDAVDLIFMSDGHDNQWDRNDIMLAVKRLYRVSSATIVEYGYYADRALLSKIADTLGGTLIFAGDMPSYTGAIAKSFSRKPGDASKRLNISLNQRVIGEFAFALTNDGELLSFACPGGQGGQFLVPTERVGRIHFLSDNGGGVPMSETEGPLYAAVSLLATKGQPDLIFPILRALGDVRFINMFTNCYGKQAYTDFQQDALAAAFGNGRLAEGYNPNLVPNDNAFTVLDLLEILSDSYFVTDPGHLKYNRIGRKRVQAAEKLGQDALDKVNGALQAFDGTVDGAKELNKVLSDAIATSSGQINFVREAFFARQIDGVVTSENRANLSWRVKIEGHVDLRNVPGITDYANTIPVDFKTHVYETYNIIRDGMLNIEVLPMILDGNATQKLKQLESEGALPNGLIVHGDDKVVYFHLGLLPIVNRRMVESVDGRIFKAEFQSIIAGAEIKVIKYFLSTYHPGHKDRTMADLYGPEAAEFLRGLGITGNGFSPKKDTLPPTDAYITREIKIAIKGYSSLPKVEDVIERMNNGGKLTPPMKLMEAKIRECMLHQGEMSVLMGLLYAAQQKAGDINRFLTSKKFSILVGQVWPLPSVEDTEFVFDFMLPWSGEKLTLTGTIEAKNVEVKI